VHLANVLVYTHDVEMARDVDTEDGFCLVRHAEVVTDFCVTLTDQVEVVS